jgi:hypothetical protein
VVDEYKVSNTLLTEDIYVRIIRLETHIYLGASIADDVGCLLVVAICGAEIRGVCEEFGAGGQGEEMRVGQTRLFSGDGIPPKGWDTAITRTTARRSFSSLYQLWTTTTTRSTFGVDVSCTICLYTPHQKRGLLISFQKIKIAQHANTLDRLLRSQERHPASLCL